MKFILFAFCGMMGFMCLWTLWKDDRRESVFVCSALIHTASLVHGSKGDTNTHAEGLSILSGFLSLLKPLAVIGVFFLLFMGFVVLIGFEILSAWSCGKMVFDPNYPFYQIVGFGSVFLQVLIFIQFLWGLSFLKESCNCFLKKLTLSFQVMLLNGTSKVKVLTGSALIYFCTELGEVWLEPPFCWVSCTSLT